MRWHRRPKGWPARRTFSAVDQPQLVVLFELPTNTEMTNDPKSPEYNAKARDAIMDLCPFYDPNHKCGIVREHVFKDCLTELRERERMALESTRRLEALSSAGMTKILQLESPKATSNALHELAERWEVEASRIDSDTGAAYPDQNRAEADLGWGSAAGLRKAADELRGILAEIDQTRIQLSEARKGCPKCGSWRFIPSVSGNDGYCETCHERVPILRNT